MAWNDRLGFHYRGKDKRGVSKWVGSWDGVLRWIGTIFLTYSSLAAVGTVGMLIYALLTFSWPAAFNPLLYVAFIHMLTFGGIGLWSLRMRRHILSLATPFQVSARFGVPQATLEQIAQEKGIKPRMNLNGLDYYNPADFDSDAVTLLRGTTQPQESQEVLLRPANSSGATSPEQLLRVPNTAAIVDTGHFTVTMPSSSNVEQQEIQQR
jgi:hypothetical protein